MRVVVMKMAKGFLLMPEDREDGEAADPSGVAVSTWSEAVRELKAWLGVRENAEHGQA